MGCVNSTQEAARQGAAGTADAFNKGVEGTKSAALNSADATKSAAHDATKAASTQATKKAEQLGTATKQKASEMISLKENIMKSIPQQKEHVQLLITELNRHNQYRLKHGAGPLTLNMQLCKHAAKYAKHLSDNNKFEHSDCKWNGKDVGQNLAMSTRPAQNFTKMWYDQIKDYDFKKAGFTSGTGHFTQVVWKDSKQLGLGFCKGILVGNYYPAGNFEGMFKNNVLPAS